MKHIDIQNSKRLRSHKTRVLCLAIMMVIMRQYVHAQTCFNSLKLPLSIEIPEASRPEIFQVIKDCRNRRNQRMYGNLHFNGAFIDNSILTERSDSSSTFDILLSMKTCWGPAFFIFDIAIGSDTMHLIVDYSADSVLSDGYYENLLIDSLQLGWEPGSSKTLILSLSIDYNIKSTLRNTREGELQNKTMVILNQKFRRRWPCDIDRYPLRDRSR